MRQKLGFNFSRVHFFAGDIDYVRGSADYPNARFSDLDKVIREEMPPPSLDGSGRGK